MTTYQGAQVPQHPADHAGHARDGLEEDHAAEPALLGHAQHLVAGGDVEAGADDADRRERRAVLARARLDVRDLDPLHLLGCVRGLAQEVRRLLRRALQLRLAGERAHRVERVRLLLERKVLEVGALALRRLRRHV